MELLLGNLAVVVGVVPVEVRALALVSAAGHCLESESSMPGFEPASVSIVEAPDSHVRVDRDDLKVG